MSYGKADPPSSSAKPHLAIRNPSEWIIRFAPLVREGGPVHPHGPAEQSG